MIPAPRLTGPRKPERAPHALPVWELEVEDDEPPEDSAAVLFLTGAMFVVLFLLIFGVIAPALT